MLILLAIAALALVVKLMIVLSKIWLRLVAFFLIVLVALVILFIVI